MTNGIKATRSLLAELAEAGLLDVAFHVDTTQGRKGYRTESELNEIRQQYIDRTRDLPLSVMFNTTVHDGNFHEIPALVKFFKSHAGKVRTASFQLQADTGRGIARGRGATITPATVAQQIQRGAAAAINFGSSLIGHPNCNRYGLCLAVNGALYDLLDEPAFIERIQPATAHIVFDRAHPQTTVKQFASWLVTHPRYLLPSFVWAGKKLWQIKKNLLAARGRINTISFVIHNFMDADSLERERIQACVFKTMTAQGPLSMCL
jgi:uncharacterized radical SAM superfamily Fe-S cluster-containing enzyme